MQPADLSVLDLLLKLWPMVFAIVGVCIAVGVGLHRIKQLEQAPAVGSIKRLLFRDDGELIYMRKEEIGKELAERDVRIAALEKRLGHDERDYLPKETHEKLCEIAGFKVLQRLDENMKMMETRIVSTVQAVMQGQTDMLIRVLKRNGTGGDGDNGKSV